MPSMRVARSQYFSIPNGDQLLLSEFCRNELPLPFDAYPRVDAIPPDATLMLSFDTPVLDLRRGALTSAGTHLASSPRPRSPDNCFALTLHSPGRAHSHRYAPPSRRGHRSERRSLTDGERLHGHARGSMHATAATKQSPPARASVGTLLKGAALADADLPSPRRWPCFGRLCRRSCSPRRDRRNYHSHRRPRVSETAENSW